jgi:hypothetical protein
MIRTVACIVAISALPTLTVGCATGPISLGVTAAGDAFFGLFGLDSFRKSHADDTFLIEKAVVLEAAIHALDVMTLQIEETTEEGDTTIITGASQSSKASMKFSTSIREISSTVTNVSIRAGRGLLKPDHSTAEEIMNQLVLRLEKTTSASRSPNNFTSSSRNSRSSEKIAMRMLSVMLPIPRVAKEFLVILRPTISK